MRSTASLARSRVRVCRSCRICVVRAVRTMSAANDYNDQDVIAGILNPYIEEKGLKRSDFFITTKVPAGFGGAAACKAVRRHVCGRSRRSVPHCADCIARARAGPERFAEHSQAEPAAAQDRLRGLGAAPQAVPNRGAEQRAVVRTRRSEGLTYDLRLGGVLLSHWWCGLCSRSAGKG